MGVNGIYGLSGSGLDIDSMVKVGMLGKQNEYDKMAQKYTKNEWTKAALLDVYSNVSTFNMSTLSQYKMSSNMNARAVDSTSSAVSATANLTALNGTHTVKVDQLASNAYLISSTEVTRKNENAESGSAKLADMLFKADMVQRTDDSRKFDVIYGEGDNKFKATFGYDDIALDLTISDGSGKEVSIQYTYGDLYGDDGKTFNDLVADIKAGGLNIKANYDSVNERFSIYNTETGSGNNIIFKMTNDPAIVTSQNYEDYGTVSDPDDANIRSVTGLSGTDLDAIAALNTRDFLNNLNFVQSANGETTTVNFTTTDEKTLDGLDAIIVVDGATYKKSENKVTVDGVTYNVTDKTDGIARVTISQDVDGIVDKVKSFIEDYNKLLSSFYTQYDEKPESGYKPLTQSQKDAMKEEQITKWEEKAKKGLLYHDKTLGSIISQMRSAISTKVEGIDSVEVDGQTKTYNSIFSLGISTTGIKGQLTLDETKLRKALSEDSNSVYNVFAKLDSNYKDPKTGKSVERTSHNGIAQRLGDIFSSSLKSIRSRSGSSADITEDSELNNLLRNLQTKMSNFKKMMDAFENKLYKKYDKMESMLAKLGSQLNYIMGGQQ